MPNSTAYPSEPWEAFEARMAAFKAKKQTEAFFLRKSRTLYYTSPEARELRRADAMFATGGR
jgi:hypothetical protein